MATDRRPGYVVPTTRDVRSVGEMLTDVDYLARQLLIDVTGDDAGHLVRSWPDVVFAGREARGCWSRAGGALPGYMAAPNPLMAGMFSPDKN